MKIETRDSISEKIGEKTGLGKKTTKMVLDSLLEAIQSSVYAGDEVAFRGFGRFVLKQTKVSKCNLPGLEGDIKPRMKVAFQATKKPRA